MDIHWKEDRSNLLQRIRTDWCSMGNTKYSCGRSMCDVGRLWGWRSSPLRPWLPNILSDWINDTTNHKLWCKTAEQEKRSTKDNYSNVLENLVVSHLPTEHMAAAHNARSSKVIVNKIIEIIHQEGVQYMHHAEHKFHFIKSGRIPFSPDSSIWIRRCQVYRSILRYHAGKMKNWSNLKRSDWRCGIGGLLQMSLKDIHDCLQVAHNKCKYFRKHGHC